MLTGPQLGQAIEAARIKKGISKKALAERFRVSPPSVQDWVKRGTIEKQRLSELWAYFSDVVGPEHWGLTSWTDSHPLPERLSAHPVAQEPIHLGYETALTTVRQVPVLGTLSMGADGMFELRTGPEGRPIGHVPALASSANSYALQIFGDELYPAVRHGTCLVVAPGSRCHEGELMLMETAGGYYIICELVTQSPDAITWTPAKGGQRQTMGRSDIVAMHPITNQIPSSRFTST